MLVIGVNLSLLVPASINPTERLRMLELGGMWLLLWVTVMGLLCAGSHARPRVGIGKVAGIREGSPTRVT